MEEGHPRQKVSLCILMGSFPKITKMMEEEYGYINVPPRASGNRQQTGRVWTQEQGLSARSGRAAAWETEELSSRLNTVCVCRGVWTGWGRGDGETQAGDTG